MITYRQRFARAAPALRAKRFDDSKNRGRASPVKKGSGQRNPCRVRAACVSTWLGEGACGVCSCAVILCGSVSSILHLSLTRALVKPVRRACAAGNSDRTPRSSCPVRARAAVRAKCSLAGLTTRGPATRGAAARAACVSTWLGEHYIYVRPFSVF